MPESAIQTEAPHQSGFPRSNFDDDVFTEYVQVPGHQLIIIIGTRAVYIPLQFVERRFSALVLRLSETEQNCSLLLWKMISEIS